MNNSKHPILWSCASLVSALAMLVLVGCQSTKEETAKTTTTTAVTAAPAEAAPATTAETAPATTAKTAPAMASETKASTIRIDAGSDTNYVDSESNVWLADQGFDDGDVVTRDEDMRITNTTDQALYRTEHYDMTSFSEAVPNGKYTVKLHFAETYEGIGGPGDRVFSFNVGGQHEFKDFDVWVKAGGPQTAYVVKVPDVDVTDGKLVITFTPDVQSPEINGIEIIPAP